MSGIRNLTGICQDIHRNRANVDTSPIPRIENGDAKKIAKYVDGIMNCNIEIQEAESKINDIVFKAFNLSEDEIVQINKCTGKEAA